MSRALGLFVLIVATGACGAESWSFDHDASDEDSNVSAGGDAATTDDRSSSGPDAAHESGPEASLLREAGPAAAEAASRCSVDGDCPSDAPLCVQPAGQCVRCTTNVECARDGGTSACNASTGACVQCTSSSDCSGATPNCNTTTNRCVQCLSSAECNVESICQLASNTCTKMF